MSVIFLSDLSLGRMGQAGTFERPELKRGSILYSFVTGRDGKAVVLSIREDGKMATILGLGYRPYRTTTEIAYLRPLSKKFGIGIYFPDTPEFISEEEIQKAIEAEEVYAAQEAEKARLAKIAAAEEKARLIEEFKGIMTPLKDGGDAKKNLIAMLKHKFPGTKFSVRKDGYSCYNVEWIDGPETNEVYPVTGMFQDHHIDFTGDYMDYNPSIFNNVFGGFKHVFNYRKNTK